MGKRVEEWMPWIALSSVTALGLGVILAFADAAGWLPGRSRAAGPLPAKTATPFAHPDQRSEVLPLALKPPEQRAEFLEAIATEDNTPENARARYLLATDLIAQGRGGQAIPLLENLAADYPPLAAHSQIKLGEAQKASKQGDAAQKTWKGVLQTHGNEPAAAEALFQLGKEQPQYWDQLIQRFPSHPRSVEVAYKKLVETPNSPNEKALLLLMTRHGIHYPDVLSLVDLLVEKYGAQLTPAEWQDIGFAYWERQDYEGAGQAYSKASPSPQSLYRAGRGWQIAGKATAAIARYEALNAQFPNAPETAEGLIKHSYMVDEAIAVGLLDQVVERFPARAGEALAEKAKIFDALNSPDTAAQIRDTVLTQYSKSEAAAELRGQYAKNAGEAGNWSGGMQWADQLIQENPDAEITAEVGFLAGKWALRAGQTQDATKRFEQVIRHHPDSYFAWRSAVALGWDVGDFRTVRSLQPAISLPAQRERLPAGSETLQELYLLGQDRDAWSLWQVEFKNVQEPTVEEQFTDGVLRVGVGDNLDGIFMVSSLNWRDEPAEQAKVKELKQHPAYSKAVYPFPYVDLIAEWSAARSLNPLLVTALIRQESRFEAQIKSAVGAVGLMQVMPETAEWIQAKANIPSYNLENPADNIKMGTWYLDYTHSEYGDHSLYAVASYNAGPGNVADWIARQNYIDEDDFAEKIPFPETKGYIRSVFGGYWNYLRLYNPEVAQRIEILQKSGS